MHSGHPCLGTSVSAILSAWMPATQTLRRELLPARQAEAVQRSFGATRLKVATCRPLSAYPLTCTVPRATLHSSLPFSGPWKADPTKSLYCLAWLRCLWVLPRRPESLGQAWGRPGAGLGQAGCFFPASPCISISIPYLPVCSSCQVAPLQGFQQCCFLPLIQHPCLFPRSWPDGPILR